MAHGPASALQRQDDRYVPDRDEAASGGASAAEAGPPAPVRDFYELRRILSGSCSEDSYCRSALYFAFTGRGKVWTVRCNDGFLILLRHPNQDKTLLVFFPFAGTASDFVGQVRRLCGCMPFLQGYEEVLLARIPDSVSREIFSPTWACRECRLEKIEERILDWVYPSYDVRLKSLAQPQGGKLKTYRKKINRFEAANRDIEVIRAKRLDPDELKKAVSQVSKNWIRTKLKSGVSLRDQGITVKDLMAPYRTLARLSHDLTSQIDGLILKRGTSYIAFCFWECPTSGGTVPCFAALPGSYEKGLSEYLYYRMAVQLAEEYGIMGIEDMCIGGSETASLDQFKRKLAPVREHRLHTIRFLPHAAA